MVVERLSTIFGKEQGKRRRRERLHEQLFADADKRAALPFAAL